MTQTKGIMYLDSFNIFFFFTNVDVRRFNAASQNGRLQ